MPTENIALTPVAALPSRAVSSVIDSISLESRAMASTISPDAGVTVAAIREVLEPVVVTADFTRASASGFASTTLEWASVSRRVAVSLQAGRAHVNNGALVSVLAAAAHPDVDWLIIVVPERYKNSPTFENLKAQLTELSRASGIRLDLVGVSLVAF